MSSKEYFRGRLSAFKSIHDAAGDYNRFQIDLTKRVPTDFLSAVETLIHTTEETLSNAPDLGGDLKGAMRMVGKFLVEAADRDG